MKKLFTISICFLAFSLFAQEEETKEKKSFSFSGSVDAYYRANLTAPNDENAIAPGSSFANLPGFALGMANVIASYEGEKVGFVADLVFGPRGTDAIFASPMYSDTGNIINQLYAYWDVSESVTLTMGNFNTFLGYEVISPVANFNYSTSYLFSYGPFSHTGLKADIALSDDLSLMLGVFNDTDLTEFNPTGDYAVGAQLGLNIGGDYRWRRNGEKHLFNPTTVAKLQQAVRLSDQKSYDVYAKNINEQSENLMTIRGLFEFNNIDPIPIDEVEPWTEIVKRFKTGAMSYGSISREAHENLAIAMNRIGGKSNSGEGGEDRNRFQPDVNGDSRNSAIKQVASGRFGVTSHYLTNAKEIQIKMAQGAKPGEGGQLPGEKVLPWIAAARNSTPFVGLISPPPHHDIYSIEDLAQLIYDLKNANRDARINVKLVSEVGVGTIAAGVAKAKADVVLISGYDGGTGASPLTSLKHAGLPWELGVAEAQQTLVLNNLRSRIVVECDGQLKTGRDVAIAALLGAEEFGFATAPLVASGCIMMRKCHLNTCPVGIATQDKELRKNFKGTPEHVINFFYYIAEELRSIMAELGFRTMEEMVGQTHKINANKAIKHYKAKGLDLSSILHRPAEYNQMTVRNTEKQKHNLDNVLDFKILKDSHRALYRKEQMTLSYPITNIDRTVGAIVSNEISKIYGHLGLPEDTIKINFEGSAGQSFGAFGAHGLTFNLEGNTNDYLGKGLSGAKLIVKKPAKADFVAEDNIIIGNVCLFGAVQGQAYINGIAGERFAVRNSGATAVVEGVGDHCCEYMTGGKVVVLGKTGRNFAAGMSGGIAYVYDPENKFVNGLCNTETIEFETIEKEDANDLKAMIKKHVKYTDSQRGVQLLTEWETSLNQFVRVMPTEYKRALKRLETEEQMVEALETV